MNLRTRFCENFAQIYRRLTRELKLIYLRIKPLCVITYDVIFFVYHLFKKKTI